MKVWFITGASGGFGLEWATAALERGDRVVATARTVAKLEHLVEQFGDSVLVLPLDVTDRPAVFEAVARAHAHFGRLDVVISNAGYGQFGLIEEATEQQVRDQYETNVFGTIWVIQAVLPFLREQRSGHILLLSSIGGITTFPMVSIYNSSKWAVEGIGQALAQQVGDFGIKVTILEPEGYSTEFSGTSAHFTESHPAYDEFRAKAFAALQGGESGDPKATRGPLLELVDDEQPPLRQFFGKTPLDVATADYESRLAEWRAGQDRAVRAFGVDS
ncbi:SDR family NAD(P)-dependent oxidoreductase [Microbacterium sp. NPDC077663]|uniref:SDR family NAD(P)-dependent oxidoreductase n=1 Tax=Microbacterium sp. NPDC077663 TaxID=3364189 RepID=UPI0037C9AB07